MNYVTKVELTTDKWKDYLEIGLQRIEEKDAFGDVVRIDEYYVWQLKDEIAAQNSKSVAFKIEDKKSDCKATMEAWFEKQFGTSGIWHDSPSERVYTIDDFECIKAKGIIYLIMVPNDRWIDYSNDLNGMYSDEETKDTLQSLNPEKIIYVGTSSQYIIVTNKGFMTDGHNFICFEPNEFNFRISLEEYFKESRGLNHG